MKGATASMMTAAAVAAGVVFQIVGCRNTAQLQRLGNIFLDGMLDFVKFFASIEETARDWIIQQLVAVFLKIGNLGTVQLSSL
jgi:hypothetical protein